MAGNIEIYDISMEISMDMPVYKNKQEKRPIIEMTSNYEHGARESRITMDMHTGTHIDAPAHMIKGGRDTGCFLTKNFYSKARVLDLSEISVHISESDLRDRDISEGDFVILKTQNSFDEHFNPSFVYLDRSGAKYLADLNVLGVGIDSLGIERDQPHHDSHRILLEKGILILEGLRLKDVKEGIYNLIAAPLNIKGVEAAPVRALLIK